MKTKKKRIEKNRERVKLRLRKHFISGVLFVLHWLRFLFLSPDFSLQETKLSLSKKNEDKHKTITFQSLDVHRKKKKNQRKK